MYVVPSENVFTVDVLRSSQVGRATLLRPIVEEIIDL